MPFYPTRTSFSVSATSRLFGTSEQGLHLPFEQEFGVVLAGISQAAGKVNLIGEQAARGWSYYPLDVIWAIRQRGRKVLGLDLHG